MEYVLIACVAVVFVVLSMRRRRDRRAAGPSPYVRGTELYRRSVEHRASNAILRQAQGLPPYHDESQWRDP